MVVKPKAVNGELKFYLVCFPLDEHITSCAYIRAYPMLGCRGNHIGSGVATEKTSHCLHLRRMHHYDQFLTFMVCYGGDVDRHDRLLLTSGCYAIPTTWHPIQDDQCEQATWGSGRHACIHSQNQRDRFVLRQSLRRIGITDCSNIHQTGFQQAMGDRYR